jgi:hypothetical protein
MADDDSKTTPSARRARADQTDQQVPTAPPADEGGEVTTQPVAPVDGSREAPLVIDFDDPDALEGVGTAAGATEFVRIDKDVVRKFYFPKTTRASYELLYHAGQLVPRSLLTQRAAILRAALADRTKLENYIDSSTYAAGTGATPLPTDPSAS